MGSGSVNLMQLALVNPYCLKLVLKLFKIVRINKYRHLDTFDNTQPKLSAILPDQLPSFTC